MHDHGITAGTVNDISAHRGGTNFFMPLEFSNKHL